MSIWNRYRTFEDFERNELWNSEIVAGALQALDGEWLDDDEDDDEDDDDEVAGSEAAPEGA